VKLRPFLPVNVRRWGPWVLGLIAALYVSRVFVEFAPLGWPAPLMWFAGLVLALGGFALILMAHAFGCRVTPVAVLALYLISPTINPHLAAATAFIAVTGTLLLTAHHPTIQPSSHPATQPPSHPPTQPSNHPAIQPPSHLLSDTAVFLVSLIAYIATLSPGLLPADSGEFQLVAPTLGIAHPPGYALYTLVGKLFTLIPVGTLAYRLNLMSAVLAAATLTLVNRTTRQLTSSAVAGLVSAVALAGATTFWAQATTANIRMATAFFVALLLWLLVRFGAARRDRDLVVAAFMAGLGLTHHGSLVFVVLPAALYVLWVEPTVVRNGRLLVRCAAAFALALLVLAYFPIRGAAGAPLNPGGLTTLDGFLNHVLARGFRGDILAFTGRQALLDRLAVLVNILTIQFGWPLVALAAIGLLFPLLQSPISNLQSFGQAQDRSLIPNKPWLLLAAIFTLTAGAAITYRAPQTVEYLMPAYVALVVLMGVGVAGVARLLSSPALQAVMLSIVLLLGLANVWQIAPSHRQLSRQSDTRQVVEPVLRNAPANATILSNWHWATAFWYLQTVEDLRPDVDVQYIEPAGAEPYPETWRRRLAESLDGARAVLATNRYRTYVDLPARVVAFHDAFLVTTTPVQVPAGAIRLDADFQGAIRLKAYALSNTRLGPGEDLTVRLWWEPQVDAQHDYSVFVHLVDAGGRPVGQADVRYPADRLRAGTVIEDAYPLSLLPTVPPGEYTVIAGFYFSPPEGGFQRLTTAGTDSVRLGRITLAPCQDAPVTRHRLEVPFAGGPMLVGVDYDTSRPESIRVYLHWYAATGGPWLATLSRDGQPVGTGGVPAAPVGTFITTAIDVPPDLHDLTLALATVDGKSRPPLGPWRWPLPKSSVRLPEVRAGDRYLVFGGEMALVGANWEVEGNEALVELEWLGLKPLVRDYTVSVQLLGESGWRAQDDGTPALGAIPTLKWIRGTRVVDRHRIELPQRAAGPANIQISVYDAFTQTPLSVLDDRFQRAGQGQAAVIGRINDE
jgi:4-amino-4-deoxy-L-arabinose transferase-like glycosyltransferase